MCILPGAADDPSGVTPASPGRRTFVVGDVHGHRQKLDGRRDPQRESVPGDSLVFVGDYVDRGPDSRGVIDLVLRARAGEWDGPVFTLRGNHEELMLDFADGAGEFEPEIWLQNGGVEISPATAATRRPTCSNSCPNHTWSSCAGFSRGRQDENGIYVHAGLLPGEPPGVSGRCAPLDPGAVHRFGYQWRRWSSLGTRRSSRSPRSSSPGGRT